MIHTGYSPAPEAECEVERIGGRLAGLRDQTV